MGQRRRRTLDYRPIYQPNVNRPRCDHEHPEGRDPQRPRYISSLSAIQSQKIQNEGRANRKGKLPRHGVGEAGALLLVLEEHVYYVVFFRYLVPDIATLVYVVCDR